ncbi:MAG: UvrD-helicase domain-containing protein [Bdellovibrionaceae bacterium]|nr:UvrD-helicase domain-containing protein [Pseudobdellovibrionaceae bacterium]
MSSPTFELKSKIVRAGAGAGKTTRLTENIYQSVLNYFNLHQRWPRLIVTTFTRKATQELKERLIIKACDENNMEFLEYINTGSNIHISTIHGVLNLFLRNYGHLLGWDNSFQIINGREANKLAKSIIKELDKDEKWDFWLEHFTYNDLLKLLLSYYEMKCSVSQSQPATEEYLATCIENLFKTKQKELIDLGQYVIENFDEEKWLIFGQKLTDISWENLNVNIQEVGSKPRKTKKVDPEADEFVKKNFDKIKKDLDISGLSPEEISRSVDFYKKFHILADEFVQLFLNKKQLHAKIEMQDLELITKKILEEEPALGNAFSEEWDYWLIDEYQDTSPLQEDLLKNLIGDKPCYIVGDPQQSIYLFRGARSEVFNRKEMEWKDKSETLTINYRSYPELLNFINDFFSGYGQEFLKMEESHKFGTGNKKRIVVKFNEGNESQFVCNEILQLLNQGISPENICVLARKNKSLQDMASYLNSYKVPTHVHASSGFFQRREILDVLSLVKFLVNTNDNENLISLLRSPWLAVEDPLLIAWTQKWSSRQQGLWSFLKAQDHPKVHLLNSVLKKSHEIGLLSCTLHYLKEWQVFTYSHYHDASGRRESNLWKMITQWQEQEGKPGFNIFHFLNQSQIDLSESEGGEEADAVAALEPSCVNLMTIHASKGLQFEHVFILDCGKAPQQSGGAKENNRVHIDEDQYLWSFALPAEEEAGKNKSILDHNYINLMKERELEESDRLFYVAVTRAVKNVYISWSNKIHEQSWLGRSHYELLPGKQQRDGYCSEYSESDQSIEIPSWEIKKTDEKTIEPILRLNNQSQKLQKISITKYLELQSSSFQNIDQITDQKSDNTKAEALFEGAKIAQMGSDIHLLFEKSRYQLNWQPEKYIQEKFLSKDQNTVLKAYHWVMNLKSPPMNLLLKTGYVEWGFQWLKEPYILEGQIDLWGEVQDEVWLIDYKSGSSRYTEKAISQLELYSQPLLEMGYKNIKKAILFPLEEKVVLV